MSKGLAVVIGMTIAYAASLMGMIFAYFYYKKHRGQGQSGDLSKRRETHNV